MRSRRQRLEQSRLYLVCDAQPEPFLDEVLAAGVDLVQLRMKDATDAQILRTAERFRRICTEHGTLLILNDRPDLAAEADADGVHVGQEDTAVSAARETVGRDRMVGLSTHTPDQIDAAVGADYIGVGPVFATPTKPGRRAVGVELVAYAAKHADVPFFAIGGIAPDNVEQVHSAGAERVAVVRALTGSDSPGQAARALKDALLKPGLQEAYLGTT